MSFQVCHCGTAPSYPHFADCPYPYYRDDIDGVERWAAARARLRLNMGQAATATSDMRDPTPLLHVEAKAVPQ